MLRWTGAGVTVTLVTAAAPNSEPESDVVPTEQSDRRRGENPSPVEQYRRELETVANNATLALFIMDERQHCTYMNPAAERLTGFTLAELVGRPLHEHIHHSRPDGSPYPLEECPIDQAFPRNLREQGEEVFVHRDGHFYPVAFTASPILARFYGLPREEVVGRTLREVVPEYAARVEPYYRRVLETGEPVRDVDVAVPRRPGSRGDRHLVINYFPVRVGRGEVVGVGVVALDLTERRQAEEAQREQTALVETLQRVGRSVASELDLESIVQEVTDAATSLTGAQFGAFFYNVLSEEGEAYTLYTLSGVEREKVSRFPMPRATEVFAPTFHGEGTVRSGDITRDPRYGRTAPFHGCRRGTSRSPATWRCRWSPAPARCWAASSSGTPSRNASRSATSGWRRGSRGGRRWRWTTRASTAPSAPPAPRPSAPTGSRASSWRP
ncbi:MAG TPA: PAS domain-containing protein [Longimicrobiaceae bacterium]|nr:PAS domain-containing protein [Longimicrobiaceae bacterium]